MSSEEVIPDSEPSDDDVASNGQPPVVFGIPSGSNVQPRRRRLLAASALGIERMRKDIIACADDGIAKTNSCRLQLDRLQERLDDVGDLLSDMESIFEQIKKMARMMAP